MFRIILREELTKDIVRLVIEAPAPAAKAMAGQFVVVLIDDSGERFPLTLAGWDKQKGTITLIFQIVGYSTRKLGNLNAGDYIAHILGPLGHPAEIKNYGTVFCVAGGVGIAEIYPVSAAFKDKGNRVIGIIGARSKEMVILEKELRGIYDELFITTDDGSYGKKGVITDILKELFIPSEKQIPALVYAVGPVPMMKAVSDWTRDYGVKTIVSLNPIMVDATGMCASCRCTVEGKTVYACVSGPDFDGHKVDFDELKERLNLFKEQEKAAFDRES